MTRTISVRLPEDVHRELVKRASELAVDPAILARMLVKLSLGRDDLADELKKEQKEQQERKEMAGPPISNAKAARKYLAGERRLKGEG